MPVPVAPPACAALVALSVYVKAEGDALVPVLAGSAMAVIHEGLELAEIIPRQH